MTHDPAVQPDVEAGKAVRLPERAQDLRQSDTQREALSKDTRVAVRLLCRFLGHGLSVPRFVVSDDARL
jgi:hypothetical protein